MEKEIKSAVTAQRPAQTWRRDLRRRGADVNLYFLMVQAWNSEAHTESRSSHYKTSSRCFGRWPAEWKAFCWLGPWQMGSLVLSLKTLLSGESVLDTRQDPGNGAGHSPTTLTPWSACGGCSLCWGCSSSAETSLSLAHPSLLPEASFLLPPSMGPQDQPVQPVWVLGRVLGAEGCRSVFVLVAGLQSGRPFVGKVPGKRGACSCSCRHSSVVRGILACSRSQETEGGGHFVSRAPGQQGNLILFSKTQ